MPKDKIVSWTKGAADVLIAGMTREELEYLIKTNYQFKIFGDDRPMNSRCGMYSLSMVRAENKATEVLNSVYTNLIYTEIKKQLKL